MFDKASLQIHSHTKQTWDALRNDALFGSADFPSVWYYMPVYTAKQWVKRGEDGLLPNGPDDPTIPDAVKVGTPLPRRAPHR